MAEEAAKGGWTEMQLREAMRAKRKDTAPPLFDPEEGAEGADSGALVEVARAILRDQRPHEDDPSLVILPVDDIARLEAALGGF